MNIIITSHLSIKCSYLGKENDLSPRMNFKV